MQIQNILASDSSGAASVYALPRTIVRTRAFMAIVLALGVLLTTATGVAAHGTGQVGAHTHGQAICYTGMISVNGPNVTARSSARDPMAMPGTTFYRAHLYKWTGISWELDATTPWKNSTGSGYLPKSAFTNITSGYWAVSVEIIWSSANGEYLGMSPNQFVDSHRVGSSGQTGNFCHYA